MLAVAPADAECKFFMPPGRWTAERSALVVTDSVSRLRTFVGGGQDAIGVTIKEEPEDVRRSPVCERFPKIHQRDSNNLGSSGPCMPSVL